MRSRCSPVVLAAVATLAWSSARALARVHVTDGWFVVNGERVFVKGIGHELGGGRGGIPREQSFDPETMEHDLALERRHGWRQPAQSGAGCGIRVCGSRTQRDTVDGHPRRDHGPQMNDTTAPQELHR